MPSCRVRHGKSVIGSTIRGAMPRAVYRVPHATFRVVRNTRQRYRPDIASSGDRGSEFGVWCPGTETRLVRTCSRPPSERLCVLLRWVHVGHCERHTRAFPLGEIQFASSTVTTECRARYSLAGMEVRTILLRASPRHCPTFGLCNQRYLMNSVLWDCDPSRSSSAPRSGAAFKWPSRRDTGASGAG